ncbi:snapalysin family zinc-dependent metalloprotease [Actinokineospora sp.]|uniref:snapalysin family zinc-dependent metalloprotease n=1 Tax=Actinokineospora sp. TaxID=1872133 RepID=UPI003D6A9D58
MFRRTLALVAANAAVGAAVVLGAAPATAAPIATAAPLAAVTITYDDSAAAEFKEAVAAGVAIWNQSVTNVRIVKAAVGTRANVRVIADNNWPRATLGPVRPGGSGTVWMGRQATQQGYNAIRIAAHEFGHILGLPDRRTGLCSDLMSGSSAPTSCTNAKPSTTEASQVQRNYATAVTQAPAREVILVDAA